LDQFVHRGTQSELPISDDEYGKRLEGVLKLLVDYYGIDEGTLYLSGGLDSAVLLAALNRNSQVLPCTHKLYAHRAKRESEIAESISKAQNASLKLITATDQEINISKIREAGSKGLGVIVTLEGMLAESGTKDIDSQESASTYAITGQNADTLYHVDTFAPPSRVYGVRRLLALRRTMKYRAVYSRLFLSGSFLRRILQFWPIRLPVKSRNGETRLLVESITQPAAEHVIPFAANDEDRFTTNEARKLFLAMRQARITDEVFSMSSKKGLGLDQGRKLSAIQLTLIIKLARWCRTVFNVPISYHNSLQVFNTDRLLPYQEGPLAQFFLERPLHLREVFFIKHLSEQYFKKRVGLSYRKFVLPINYSPWSDLLNFLTHAWQRLQKRVLQSRTREKDWIKGVGVQRDNIAGTEVRNSLRAILGNENRILMQYVRHPEYANYIDRLYDKLYSAESTFDIKDRSMVMELCRLINMHLFIEANVGENSAGAKSSVDRDEIKT